ncbi:MAG: CAP domain-containing protein [bacterium]|nr:CAP domain-containing protein [bacterium]
MMHRLLLTFLCAFTVTAAAIGQNDEAAFNQRQAKALNTFAKKAFKKGFPRIAKVVWMQAIKLYDEDNEDAWTSLGYVKVGASWNPDPAKKYPREDTGSGSDGQPLRNSYEKLKKDLANKHRAQAQKWAKAERRDMADKHWRMVLRWVKGDAQAEKALSHVAVGSLSGTGLEKTLYERSKMIESAVEKQSKVDYEVEKVEGIECGPLVRAQINYISVRSQHFTLHGDPEEEENLLEALQWAERALEVSKVAFPWSYSDETWPIDWAFFTDKETYQQILKGNQVPDLEWKLEHSSASNIGNTRVGATNGRQTLFDACVRNVASTYAGFGSDGFSEGIGHTLVGMMFNNNRLFAVDLKKQQGTTASEEDQEYASPDFDVWKNLSLEMAWRSTGGIPANKLPFCDAAAFTNDERIKAWSFSDYMLRRDPEMLRAMDRIALQMKKKRSKQPAEFEELFNKKYPEVTIPQLDQEWEDFWTGASPVLKAIQNNTPPLDSISKGIDKYLVAFNNARKQYNATPVKWSANLSARCKEHATYLANNKDQRGPALEHTQSVELGGSYVGSMFAEMALVDTKASSSKAKKMFDNWVYKPGYRDALLNNTILSVGMFAQGSVLVINGVSGIGSPDKANAGVRCFPKANSPRQLFNGSVNVADLGPELKKLLDKNGHGDKKVIGFPLTLHFGGTSGVPNRKGITCAMVDKKGNPIEGVYSYGGRNRTSAAPGMCVFWPLQPLKGTVSFQWTWGDGGRNQSAKGSFNAK